MFDQKLWLKLEDLTAYTNPTHSEHPRHSDDVLHQVLMQTVGREHAKEAQVETIDGIGEDHRPFWRITAIGSEPIEIPQPIWSQEYCFETAVWGSVIVLPVMDARENSSVLGAMLFSRQDKGRPLTEIDIPLLQGLAKQIAQALLRTQTDRAREMKRVIFSQVVRMSRPTGSMNFSTGSRNGSRRCERSARTLSWFQCSRRMNSHLSPTTRLKRNSRRCGVVRSGFLRLSQLGSEDRVRRRL